MIFGSFFPEGSVWFTMTGSPGPIISKLPMALRISILPVNKPIRERLQFNSEVLTLIYFDLAACLRCHVQCHRLRVVDDADLSKRQTLVVILANHFLFFLWRCFGVESGRFDYLINR